MMVKAFGLFFEFDSEEYDNTIQNLVAQGKKGYSCVIDANVLAISRKYDKYKDIVNSATINTCDGSSIAVFASKIHKKRYKEYTGPDIFEKYIEKDYRHVIVGNTEENVTKMREKLKAKGINNNVFHVQVPFVPVDEFDYEGIATLLNEIGGDLIWVSLGAPKQEIFCSRLYPLINKGILFGIGAAVNFYIGKVKNTRKSVRGIRVNWIKRLFKEPKKQISRCWRYIKIIPRMLWDEKKEIRHNEISVIN